MNDTAKKVSQNRLEKEAIVAELLQKVEKAKGIIFTDYQGLTHQQIEALKKSLKSLEAEYVNTKNTLLLIALKDKINTEEEKSKFTRPTATLFIYNDVVGPLKAITKSIKEFKLPLIKFGILDGKVLAEDDIVKISTLPPLDVLRAQLLGNMKGPISGLHRALNWNLQKLVMTLKAIETKKS
ncbi:MAG TPA: 50S ribosomal protein L10 [Candidatus Saccharimonadales bacterium]|nr:50S ribosomal protein L10 [Candidatus Saccharimonadales bacterium]